MTNQNDIPQEELEQKITEAELEAQIEEEAPVEEELVEDVPASVETEAPVSPEKVKKETPSKARMIWRKFLIWMVVIAISFAGGFFFDTIFRYQPQSIELADAKNNVQSLKAEVERLSLFEEENIALSEQVQEITIHITLLSTKAAVSDASLAIEQDRTADAKLALDLVGSTLETLKEMLNEDQAEVVENMIQRHNLIMIELEGDGATVQTDLELLSNKLNTLEAALFASP